MLFIYSVSNATKRIKYNATYCDKKSKSTSRRSTPYSPQRVLQKIPLMTTQAMTPSILLSSPSSFVSPPPSLVSSIGVNSTLLLPPLPGAIGFVRTGVSSCLLFDENTPPMNSAEVSNTSPLRVCLWPFEMCYLKMGISYSQYFRAILGGYYLQLQLLLSKV